MVTRSKISDAILQLLLEVQCHYIDLVQVHSLRLIEDLELMSLPATAEQQGLSGVNIHYVLTLASEAAALSNSGEWQEAENAMQRAVERWNEGRAGQ